MNYFAMKAGWVVKVGETKRLLQHNTQNLAKLVYLPTKDSSGKASTQEVINTFS